MAEGHIQVMVFLPAVGAIIIYAAKLVNTIRAFVEFSSFFLCHFSGSVVFPGRCSKLIIFTNNEYNTA
jgi:hypothetical protein